MKPMNLIQKIISSHLEEPLVPAPGDEICIRVDQTITHDINAVMTYLAFEALGIDRVRTECSVSYLDHNLLYINTNTPDDHIYLQSAAKKYGVWVSRPGNGICHTVHLARFSKPGKVLMGGDSHTPSCGAVGMLAIGVGGMDIATAMTGVPMRLTIPKVVRVNLKGRLKPGVNPKEVVLEMLRRETIKGGLGKAYEYVGPGTATLSVPDRMTITNMGAEMGATTSIFPADDVVRDFFRAQLREQDFTELLPDDGALYDEEIEIDLSELEPMMACPSQPDNIRRVKDIDQTKVRQVFIGSCTNSSYSDIAKAALVLKGRHVHEDVSCTMSIASKQIYKALLRDGYIDILLDSGVRLLEFACGPCCAIGQTPPTDGVAVRTSNRNFPGRSGSLSAQVYLASPETAAACAVTGSFATAEDILGTDVGILADVHDPEFFPIDDSMLIAPLPPEAAKEVEILKGPNIAYLPVPKVPEEDLKAAVSLKARDNISTDDITPASAELSSMRSNIPAMSRFCFHRCDPGFAARAESMGSSIIIGGENYGQGSSREHAAINPMFLGVRCVIAKSIARIHKGNLINHGIIPMLFEDKSDYDRIEQGDELEIRSLPEQILAGRITIYDKTGDFSFNARLELTEREAQTVLAGGQLRSLKKQLSEMEDSNA